MGMIAEVREFILLHAGHIQVVQACMNVMGMRFLASYLVYRPIPLGPTRDIGKTVPDVWCIQGDDKPIQWLLTLFYDMLREDSSSCMACTVILAVFIVVTSLLCDLGFFASSQRILRACECSCFLRLYHLRGGSQAEDRGVMLAWELLKNISGVFPPRSTSHWWLCYYDPWTTTPQTRPPWTYDELKM